MTREEADYSDWGQIEEKNENIICVLDKIRAEIEERMRNSGGEPNRNIAFNVCLQIIDKYKAESEEE